MFEIDFSINKVTTLSKTVALLLFVLLPFAGFRLGMKYQKALDIIQESTYASQTEAKKIDKTYNSEEPDTGYMKEVIIVDSPKPNEVISSPLNVSGRARGTWFFEGSFPITLYCGTGKVLTNHYATTQDDWMTEDFIEFTSTITFTDRCDATGILELKKDNPSGLTELDDKVIIPVKFSK